FDFERRSKGQTKFSVQDGNAV
ncbi:hypothetical protein EVA_22660, partial [gut metagenome]